MIQLLKQLILNEDGPTATEYAVCLAVIILVAFVAIGAFGDTVYNMFTNICETIEKML
jgi:Flp pilus assembly pilin Flp